MCIYNEECTVCDGKFIPHDMVQCFNDKLYHHDCVISYPIKYYAMVGNECLGETEYDYLEFTDEGWIY